MQDRCPAGWSAVSGSEPPVSIHPTVAKAIGEFDAVIIGPGSFYTSLMPIFLVGGVPEALAQVKGPVILVTNLLTEGRGMIGFTAADAVARIEQAIQRKIDVVITNTKWPSSEILGRYALEHKHRSRRKACLTQMVGGDFWTSEIARHDRASRVRLSVLSAGSLRLATMAFREREDQDFWVSFCFVPS